MKLPLAVNLKSGKRAQPIDPDTKEPVDVIFITRVVELRQPEKEAVKVRDRNYLPASQLPRARSAQMRHCIEAALKEQLNGSDGHDMRVAIVSEALAFGKSQDEIVRLFAGQDDFDETITAKYVVDIASRGYIPWRCETLQDRCSNFICCDGCPLSLLGAVGHAEIVAEPAVAR
jgi:DNA primase large subunit